MRSRFGDVVVYRAGAPGEVHLHMNLRTRRRIDLIAQALMLAFAWPLFATYNLVVSGADEEEPGRKKPEYSAAALFLCVTSGIWAAAWAATLWLL